jgi:polyisoprenoid-binding protein YceI
MRALLAALLTTVLVSCTGEVAPTEAPEAAEPSPVTPAAAPPAESCALSTSAKGQQLTWTAFKFTERLGVEGSFDTITTTPGTPGDAAWKAIDRMTFQIDTASVNTGNPGRDDKIRQHFFGTLENFQTISGRIKANSPGKATLFIEMNGQRHSVVVDVSPVAEGVVLTGTIDVEQWGAGPAIAALNEACGAVHTGEDGVSKLWPQVELRATIPIERTCR